MFLAQVCALALLQAPVLPQEPLVHTFSIVARDPSTGQIGVAVQSHSFAVGSLCLHARAGVGAVATQSFVLKDYGPNLLADLQAGLAPAAALRARLAADPGAALRQVGVVDASGRVSVHTGDRCIRSAGHEIGDGFAVQANLMVNDGVVPSMAAAFRASTGPLPERLLAALEGAQNAGGDLRGMQSAALLVVQGVSPEHSWQGVLADLRVDDHTNPLLEIRRLLQVQRASEAAQEASDLLEQGEVRAAEAAWERAASLNPVSHEMRFWRAISLLSAKAEDSAVAMLGPLFRSDPVWFDMLKRIAEMGMVPQGGRLWARLVALVPDPSEQREVPHPPDTDRIRDFHLPSPLLTSFWGRPMETKAAVYFPESFQYGEILPVVYHVHGFGGSHEAAWGDRGVAWLEQATGTPLPHRMVHVFLDGKHSLGHHEFADSANNGPVETALMEEFIPALESRFGLAGAKNGGRFLTGHSSGGWSTLWLQIRHPDFFDGTWSTAPDPVDFRQFTGVNIYQNENFYQDSLGREIPVMRYAGAWVATARELLEQELRRDGEWGGQFASFESVFSPRGESGRPMALFDRDSGAMNAEVAEAWRKYDIRQILQDQWETLGPRLAGKLHLWCGLEDTYRLEEAVQSLQETLTELGSDADILIVPGRDHGSLFAPHPELWPQGMRARILNEMFAQWENSVASAQTSSDSVGGSPATEPKKKSFP